MRNIILWVHIGAAGIWLGANFTQAIAAPVMRAKGATAEAAWWLTTVAMGRRLYTPAAIVALLTGVELVRSGAFGYGDAFVLIGIAMVVVSALLGVLVFARQGRHVAAGLEAGDDVQPLRARLVAFGRLDTALILFTMYAMVAKLGA